MSDEEVVDLYLHDTAVLKERIRALEAGDVEALDRIAARLLDLQLQFADLVDRVHDLRDAVRFLVSARARDGRPRP